MFRVARMIVLFPAALCVDAWNAGVVVVEPRIVHSSVSGVAHAQLFSSLSVSD
jgi:hypothetical protein